MKLQDFSAFGAREQRNGLIPGLEVVSSPGLHAGWPSRISSLAFLSVFISGKKASLSGKTN